jgi:hypothetical protein
MRIGRRGLVRALALAPVYALIVGLVFAEPPTSTAVQWVALLNLALIYGALVGSWWSCIVPGAVFAAGVAVEVMEATIPSFGGEIPLGLVLLVGSLGALVGISAGVVTGKAARRRMG